MKKTVQTFLYILLLSGMLFAVIYLLTQNDKEGKKIFGYQMYIVLSDSMKPVFSSGDLIFVKSVDPNTLNEGDIISYRSRDPESFGEIITHQIVDVEYSGQQFITKGTNSDTIDQTPVEAEFVLGKFQFDIPYLGYVFNFLRTNQGFVLLFIVPLSLMIIVEFVRFFQLIYLYKKAEMDDMLEQKEKELDAFKQRFEALNKKIDLIEKGQSEKEGEEKNEKKDD